MVFHLPQIGHNILDNVPVTWYNGFNGRGSTD